MTSSPDVPTITVTGTGSVSGVPDRLHLDVGVEVRRPTAPHAYLQAAEAASRVFDALDALAFPALTRATRQVGLRADIRWGENQEQQVSGYVASQDLTVTIDNLASASEVLDAVVLAGGDDARITSLTFGFSDPAARANLAQKAAWQDARDRAQRWADLAGCTLGAVDSVSEEAGAGSRPMMRTMLAGDSSMPVVPGEAAVVCSVTVSWRIGRSE
ncbi:SIMPL domain-containing protein [Arthrobacter sp. CAN_A1]|uniref:SIMPL domain-containing protein n=1 Tax=Arthrobacter sp. CAN_A1 TaxID=2787717 RepID=UPI0018CAC621